MMARRRASHREPRNASSSLVEDHRAQAAHATSPATVAVTSSSRSPPQHQHVVSMGDSMQKGCDTHSTTRPPENSVPAWMKHSWLPHGSRP